MGASTSSPSLLLRMWEASSWRWTSRSWTSTTRSSSSTRLSLATKQKITTHSHRGFLGGQSLFCFIVCLLKWNISELKFPVSGRQRKGWSRFLSWCCWTRTVTGSSSLGEDSAQIQSPLLLISQLKFKLLFIISRWLTETWPLGVDVAIQGRVDEGELQL